MNKLFLTTILTVVAISSQASAESAARMKAERHADRIAISNADPTLTKAEKTAILDNVAPLKNVNGIIELSGHAPTSAPINPAPVAAIPATLTQNRIAIKTADPALSSTQVKTIATSITSSVPTISPVVTNINGAVLIGPASPTINQAMPAQLNTSNSTQMNAIAPIAPTSDTMATAVTHRGNRPFAEANENNGTHAGMNDDLSGGLGAGGDVIVGEAFGTTYNVMPSGGGGTATAISQPISPERGY